MRAHAIVIFLVLGLPLLAFMGCASKSSSDLSHQNPPSLVPTDTASPSGDPPHPPPSRTDAIPAGALKVLPPEDRYPPILHSESYDAPVPLGGPVDTAGAEDSSFITPDGNDLYLFFTPDVRVPVEKQLLDNVTGIYASHLVDGNWSEPERVMLQDPGKLALDGCEFVRGETIWFCSAREGFEGINWFKADQSGGRWAGWNPVDFDSSYKVGELHISSDGTELYFGSDRQGGKGGLDLYVSTKRDGVWQPPQGIAILNTPDTEGWPFLSEDGSELWFTRSYQGSPAIFRSIRGQDCLDPSSCWEEPELIVSQFAGEPTLDRDGNLYFVHHFYKDSKMIEADIYIAEKKR